MDAAKKEGRLDVHINVAQVPILDAGVFQKQFPQIKLMHLAWRGGEPIQRILAERRAGKYLADVHIGGVTTNLSLYRGNALDPIKPVLILPEVVDESKWWHGQHRYGDPERAYAFNYVGVPQTVDVSYNTRFADSKELRSLWSLLEPKWKGKIVALDPRAGGPGGGTLRFIYHHDKFGPDFIRRFFSSKAAVLTRDRRQAVDWLAAGKFALCFLCSDSDVQRARLQGLPVDTFEAVEGAAGLVTQAGSVGLLNRAPHPNAAKIFINWLLSREGQITLQGAIAKSGGLAPDSLRIDIPKDDVVPKNRRLDKVQYLAMDIPSRLDTEPVIFKLVEDSLAEAERK